MNVHNRYSHNNSLTYTNWTNGETQDLGVIINYEYSIAYVLAHPESISGLRALANSGANYVEIFEDDPFFGTHWIEAVYCIGKRKQSNPSGGGDGFNIWGDISNSFLVGAAANQPTYFRSSQIAKEGKFAVDGWKTYSNAFKGNQYVSSASVKEAKAAFNSVAKTTSRISTGLTLVSFGVTYANYAAGNVSEGRYYVQQTINAIGLFGPWGAGIAIGLGTVDAIWGDQIEGWIRE